MCVTGDFLTPAAHVVVFASDRFLTLHVNNSFVEKKMTGDRI